MGIKPIESSTREASVWITFKKVPPALVTPEGISWLASQVGKPINKFVRDGLDIKVCVIRDLTNQPKMRLVVALARGVSRGGRLECFPSQKSLFW
ncbi:hypothetical protein LINPERPRIM_LOCUS21562 [Linum perenne]